MTWYLPEPLTWCSVDLGTPLARAPWTGNIEVNTLNSHMTPPNPPFWESSHHIEHMFWLATSKHRQHWKKTKKHLTIRVSTWNKTLGGTLFGFAKWNMSSSTVLLFFIFRFTTSGYVSFASATIQSHAIKMSHCISRYLWTWTMHGSYILYAHKNRPQVKT